jgi:hypothetical protein
MMREPQTFIGKLRQAAGTITAPAAWISAVFLL